jgi:hypothetical protein
MANFFFKFRQMPLTNALHTLAEDIEKASNEPNFEKAKNYSDHFSEILLFIFGIENQSDSRYFFFKIIRKNRFLAGWREFIRIIQKPKVKTFKIRKFIKQNSIF